MENDSGNLKVKIPGSTDGVTYDSNGLKVDNTVVRTSGDQTIGGTKTFSSIPMLPAIDPTNDNHAVRKAYVDSVAQGLSWEDPVFAHTQLVDGSSGVGGIRPAMTIEVLDHTGFSAGDTITINYNDGTAKSFVLTAVDNASPGPGEFDVNTSRVTSNEALAQNIRDAIFSSNDPDSDKWDTTGVTFSQDAYIYIVYDEPAELTSGTIDFSAGITSNDAARWNATESNLGQLWENLETNETHFAQDQDYAYTWDANDNKWVQVSGGGSIPDATKSVKGKVQIGDGIAVSSGVISIDLASNSGLELTGSTPNQQLRVSSALAGDGLTGGSGSALEVVAADIAGDGLEDDGSNNLRISTSAAGDGLSGGGGNALSVDVTQIVDDVTVEEDGSNNIRVKEDGINETHIDWGSGSNQVDATSVPLDSGGTYGGSASNVQDALEELETNTTTEAFKTIAVSGQSSVVADQKDDTLTFEAGTGITITTDATNDKVTITNSDPAANLTASNGVERVGDDFRADLMSNGGLKIVGTELAVEPNDFAGSGLEDDGSDNLRIASSAAGDGLTGGSGSPLAVQVSDIVDDATVEEDGSNNIRVKADGINETHIDWGSGANQVDATSIPLDTGGTYGGSATNVQDALEELYTQAAKMDIEYFTLTATDITNKYVDLANPPEDPADTQLFVYQGTMQRYNVDFVVKSDGAQVKRLSWADADCPNGSGLEADLEAGDVLIVQYGTQ